MSPKFATILCYWGGKICDGPEGVSYNMSPNKAIKVEHGIPFDQLIDKMYLAASVDKRRYRVKLVCRYPSVVGKVMRYVPLPIKDNDDIEIMFDALNLHKELSNIDLYLEVEDIGPKRHMEMLWGTQESVLKENEASLLYEIEERSNEVLPTKRRANEDVNTISQNHVNNAISCEFDKDDEVFVNGDEADNGVQVPSFFTRIEGIEMATAGYEMVSSCETKNDITRELGKSSFKDKEELIRDIKLYSIKKHMQYEVVETCPTIWKIRCKLCSESGCKWQLRACKRKRSGNFEITKYTGPHTCLDYRISQDHPNLDASLIAQETQHVIQEEPSISIPALRAKIIDKLGYNVSYKKVWSGKQKAIEQIFGKEKGSPHSMGRGRPRSTRLQNGVDIEGVKKTILCGICRQSGHNQKTCPSKL